MAIIISKNGKNAKKIDSSAFEKEVRLQQYIYDNPESIPLYDIKQDIRLLILAREFSTNSGPIDAIGIDRDGEIYLIETKLYDNADKRRVVAQVLDYGASLWRYSGNFSEFLGALEEDVIEKFKIGLNQKLKDFFEAEDEEISVILENMERNLRNGNFRFVVLMDKLHAELKDLIVFINQNSKFDIFAVELEYYKYEDYQIVIPKLFGSEVKKDVPGGRRGGKQWDEAAFRAHAKEKVADEETLRRFLEVYAFGVKELGEPSFGTGTDAGRAVFKIDYPKAKSGRLPLFRLKSNGQIKIGFWGITKEVSGKEGQELSESFVRKLAKLSGIKQWYEQTVREIHEGKRGQAEKFDFPGKNLAFVDAFPDDKSVEAFKSAIREFKKELKSSL